MSGATGEPLEQACVHALSAAGELAAGDPAFVERHAQLAMARAVARAIEQRQALVAEAGTGVGKTFAYLVPLLLSGRRALVSTATKSLQDQLFLRDLPRLRRSLRQPARLALLKGRASYLCLHRLRQARDSATLPDRFAVRTLARVEQWASVTRSGDLAELGGLDERSPVIPLVTSTRDNCLGTECPSYRDCHLMRARRDAMAADLVVINHHLFFADLALRDSGVAELLPTVDAVVFDEAHQLVDSGVQFLGVQLGSGQLIDFARDLLAAGLAQARGLRDWAALAAGCERAARDLRLACAGALREPRGTIKLAWRERAEAPVFGAALAALHAALQRCVDALDDLLGSAPDLARLAQRAIELTQRVASFAGDAAADRVRWIDVSPRDARLIESPLDIRALLAEQRASAARCWIFTSATLGDDEPLSWFSQAAALEDAPKLRVDSPFDYRRHARVWVPSQLPRPNEAGHPAAIGELAAMLAGRLGGRTFVLTTTLRVLEPIAQALRDAAQRDDLALEVLVQGSQPRRLLLERFADGRGRVLVGSQSFWEGIDVPGDALQCVLIDKLPFPPPNDPLVQARAQALRARGRDPFDDYFVADAAVSLKQGAGRLIRHEDDRGLLVIGDVRLRRMGYGQRLLRALPPMTPLDNEAQALGWLEELAAARV
ncbi:MAG: ATP-dependent DNA helicase [Burkholderiaceae bacterium]|nr:ATP-dependent DNA helicase [Ideonella sp.]MCC7287853.1 ATP-dependent DNA helicase [Burkholderiaceae bacterium]